jgi:hypothetical protein
MVVAELAHQPFLNQSLAPPDGGTEPQLLVSVKNAENSSLHNKALVDPSVLEAAHKMGLIKALAKKGPKAIRTAVETAAKATKRRNSYAKKLEALGMILKD